MISINGYPICDILRLLATYLPTPGLINCALRGQYAARHAAGSHRRCGRGSQQRSRLYLAGEDARFACHCAILPAKIVEVETGLVDCMMDAAV